MQQQTNTCAQIPRAEAIARLNDHLRKTGTGGMIVITRGVKHLSGFNAATLAEALAAYDEFDADGDPHGERDFGTLTLFGADTIWKVDYYDASMTACNSFGSCSTPHLTVVQSILCIARCRPAWDYSFRDSSKRVGPLKRNESS